MNFISDEMLNTKNRIAEIEHLRIKLRDSMNIIMNELNDIQTVSQNKKTVVFDATPNTPGRVFWEISYVVYGASWRTYYESKANPAESRIEPSYFVKIKQRTGEVWEDTKVILSTAQPAVGGTAPEPQPWYINLFVPRTEARAKKAMPVEAMASSASAKDMEAEEEVYESAPPVETGIAVNYLLSGKYSIKSGEPAKKLKVCDVSLDADFEYFIIPRMTELAYLNGEAKNITSYPFLGGEASTYVGDDLRAGCI